jgi:hypothetical protein
MHNLFDLCNLRKKMTENISLPEVLSIAVNSESKEFAVIGKHAQPPRNSLRQNVFEIEQICRKRIKENDPTSAIHSK